METIALSPHAQSALDKITKLEKAKYAIILTKTVADAIREAKRIPNGHLYAAIMNMVSYADYTMVINILKSGKVIREANNELFWAV